ncbi:transglutaminase family protein [Echinicola sp. 20G]|uniref:transglutaminase family protein n=1 Tax=Echinicola sp. 20G TaxID=2781961 RepID=UPI0019109978|nr:transglutaminase family protein [Echinicola sp. 20G]
MEKKIKIVHKTEYNFDEEVFIEPHYLRFKPRNTPFNIVESNQFTVFPKPTGLSEQWDPENNQIYFCWFDGKHHLLNILWESIVRLEEYNPFNYIIFPTGYYNLPINYSLELKDLLFASLVVDHINSPLIEYGNQILEKSVFKTLHFISELTKKIHSDFNLVSRMEGEPYAADKTFNLKKGSCRDLSWMEIQLLRHSGIAARFVSGYYFIESENLEHELHAWVEVFLPGAGWVGFDPSHGTAVGSSHIPICSSAHYRNTMPVIGSFRGNAQASLETKLIIEKMN